MASATFAPSPPKTTSTQTIKKLRTILSPPVSRDKAGNLLIKIEITTSSAIIHCALSEHVGDRDNRKVIFLADQTCVVCFKDSGVFSPDPVYLDANVLTDVQVLQNNTDTEFSVGLEQPLEVKAEPKLWIP